MAKISWLWHLALGIGLVCIHAQGAAAQLLKPSFDQNVLTFWEVVALQRYRAASDFKRRPGALGFHDSKIQIARSQLTGIGVFKLGTAYTHTRFSFADDTDLGLATAKPFETAHDAQVSLQFSTRLHPRWVGRLFGAVGVQMASGASFDDSLYSRFALGVSYQVSDTLAMGPGVLVRASFAEDFAIVPLVVVDWEITDRLAFRSRSDFRVSYTLDAQRTLTLSAVASPFDRKQFRLDETDTVSRGIVEMKAFTAGAEVRWQPLLPLTIKGNLFAVFNQTLTIDDESGREVVDESLKNSVEMMVSVRYRF